MKRVSLRERWAWCLFDFANSAFNTVVITFVFANFFVDVLVGDRERGDVLWSRAISCSGVVVALLAPFLASFADRSQKKRFVLVTASLGSIAATAALFWVGRADGARTASENQILIALLLVGAANVAFEIVFVFYNAFLPGLGDEHTIGKLSGYGWSFGFVGGLLCLATCLMLVGFRGPGTGWLTSEGDLAVRSTNLLVAAWFLVFALPMFAWVKDRGSALAVRHPEEPLLRRVRRSFASLRGRPDLVRFLIARLLYNDALVALIALASLYMSGTLGMETREIMMLAIWLNVVAGIGAFGFGFVDDRFGARSAILASLGLLVAGCTLAIAVPTKEAFWIAGSLVGLGMGPNQSASRTLLARLTPVGREAELAGLFALSGKSTEWACMALFGFVRGLGGSQQMALVPLLAFFVVGGVLLLAVDEGRGIAIARSEDAELSGRGADTTVP